MVKRSKIKLTFSWLIAFVLIFSPLVSTFMPIAAAETSGDFEVSVSYDANGGSGEMKPLTVACMEYITLPENGFIAPEGCTFKTWDIGGTEYAPNEEVQIRSDTVVKAVWKDVSEVSEESDVGPSAEAEPAGSVDVELPQTELPEEGVGNSAEGADGSQAEVSEGSGLPASSEMSNSESASSEKPAPGEAEKAGLDDNPDHLLAPDDSPYGGEIDYGIFPVMSFGGVRMMRSMNTMAANNSPVIGTDHPTQPGEVMLFKEAKPIAGIVNTWEVTLRIEGKDTRETSDVVLVIDRSGSMNDQGRMAAAQQAANAFVDELLPSDTTRIAVVSFSGDVTTNQGLTNDATTLKSAINGLDANGGTFTQAGVKQAEALLANSTADHKHIVLLSDGVPTYSYEIPNSTVRRDGYVRDGSDYVTGTGYASSAYGTSRVGNGSSIYSYIERYLLGRAYYNHGNSAIAEAGFAGVAGYNVYTIGLQTGGTGSDVLSRMKQNDGTFTEVSDVSQLDPVFQAIAGQIGAAVKEAAVTDPMGAGFQIPAANVSGIITVPASPPATYNATTKSISWNPGTLTTPIEPGSDIKYAELKYTIEINDDILAQTPDVNGEYPTNGSAQIQYTDAGGNQQTGTFPVPKVNPVLYKVVKELQDKDGTVITDDRSFTVQVTGPGAGGAGTVRSFTLNTNTESSTKLMTDLRYASTYTFEETGNLSDYDVSYYVDGVAVSGADRKFTITDGNTADVEVKVVNKEKPGTLTITKVLDQSVVSAKSGTRAAVSFSFSVTGPNSYNRTFDLPDNGSWTKTLTNLVKGTYTVTEITTGYTTSVQVNENPSVSGNSADVTIDIGALNQTVTVTNKQTENMSVTATKTWVNAPTDKPDIWFQLIRINSDNSETKIGSPKAVISNTVSWNQTDVGLGESLLRYDENGNEYIYKVQEVDADGNDFVPGGFSKIEDGLNVKNSFYETNPADITSLRFEKTWAGVPEGMTPPDITVQVMANNEVYATATLRYPDTVVEWKNLPLHDADGNLITYTINELGINDFDEGTPVYTESVIENVYCEPSQNQTDWSLQNPAFIITRLTKNGPFVVWTLNHIPQAERVAMLQNVIAASQPDNFKQPLKDLGQYLDGGGDYFVWLEGANVSRDILPNDQSAGQITINITFNTDGTVNASTIHYQGENTWTHFAVGGYSSKLAKITNTYNQETIDIPVTKTWEDNNDQDGMRPESITIRLLKNGTEIASKTVTEADGWAWSFTDLPKYEAGELITYTITEDTVSEYSSAVSGYNVTNTHTPGKTSVQVTKAWADGNNQDGVRPESVTIKLLADGVDTGKTLVLTATNNWTDTFTDLDEYKAGTKIVYTIEELTLGSGYTSVITGDAATGFEVTNTKTPEVVDVSGTKTWEDNNDQDGMRPESITIRLLKNGTEIASKTVTEADGWAWSFTDLPKYEAGELITYTITEDTVSEYSSAVSGYNVTNTHTPGKTSVQVTKAWADGNNQDGVRPESVTIKLLADGVDTGKTLVLTATNNWTDTFTDLDEYKAGTKIVYTIEELTLGSGYTSVITGDAATGFEVTNTKTPEVVDVSGTKTWEDNNDQDGMRPESITIRLLKNGTEIASKTVTEADGWAWSFTDLPKYEAGELITYTITEDTVSEYSSAVSGYNVTNTHTPGKTSVQVTKAWADGNNQDGVRPESVTIKLLADGVDTGKTLVLTATNNWTDTFTDLDEYKAGTKIVYTIEELTLGSGYTSVITGDAATGFEVTNTKTPEVVDVSGTKTWEDNNDQDGMRPESITIRLLKNGTEIASKTVTEADGWAWSFTDLPKYEAGELITYTITEDTVSEYSSAVSGYNVTNTHTPGKTSVQVTKAWADGNNQDGVRPESVTIKLLADGVDTGKTLVLTATNNWTDTFTDLDEYKAGTKIVYTIEELTLGSGYTSVITGDAATGFEVTNTKTPEVVDVSGTKTWEDNNDQDGMRPESITIRLLKNGTEIASKTVTEADGWAWSFTDLPKYEAGELITYTITEDTVSEYSSAVSGYNVTNTHTPGKTSVQVTKAWADGNNQDGVRPESVTIKLLADGVDTGKTLVLTATNNWTDTFTDLDEYKAGTKIVYTIEELTLGSGYTSVITGDAATGFEVTNTKTPEVVDVSGTKTWEDNNDQDGMRPESITIRLLKNGTEIASKTVTEADGWAWSFTDLPKYEAGELITYTITEDTVSEYSSAVSGYNVTNTHTPGKTSVQVTKAWADGNNQDGVRPESVTIKLLADGVDTGKTLVLTATNNWTDTFTDLDEYKAGTKIVYTIEELTLGSGYTSVITGDAATGFEVTNTKTPEVVDVSGTKTWEDNNDQDGMRPESITIRLLKNGTEIASKTVTEADGWAWSFTDLPKYEAGELITYTITEDTVSEYSSAVSGYNVTNTHTPGKTSVQVTKAWADGNNQDGVRPESVTIKLLADGVDTGKTLVLTATNNWTDTFTDLDEYKAGTKIVYTIEELTLGSGYTSVITGDAATGFEVTNTKTPEVVDVSGTKTWEDNNDQDGMRPESITIRLLKNGTEIASKTVTEADGWAWSFTDLPKYEAGELITYTITEDTVSEYSSAVSGYNVTNTHTPGKTSVQVTKAWADGNNQDGVRPESVTIKLLADGVDTGKTLVLTATNNWTDTFTDLDEYKAGTKIVYTIEELTLGSGYTSVITGDAATGFEVTNTKTPEVVDVSGTKTWEDNNDQDGMRPESITIRLLKNGTEIASKTVTEADGWAWSFTDLPKYEAGELITYTITEDTVSEYSSAVSGYNVTNTHTPGKTSVQVTKAWADGNNQDGVRPESVTIKLLADGVDTGKTLVLTATNNWTDTFTDLDEYKAGTKIVYTIEELTLGSGYTSVITGDAATGFEVTNTKTPEVVDVSGTKTWEDNNDQDGMRPESITIRLLKNGTEIASKTVTEADGWAWSFTDLPKYEAGELITYTITEDTVSEYSSAVSGYNVTNTHTPGKTSVQVTKAWADGNNQDGVRPESVTIKLLADGVDTGKTLVLTATNNWTDTFTDLDEYKAGTKIVYTIEELTLGSGYTSVITGDAATGFEVTNTKTPEVPIVPPEPKDPEDPVPLIPRTGDDGDIYPWVGVMLFSIAGLLLSVRKKLKADRD